MHADEIALPDGVARRLIIEQFPDWARLAIRRIASTGTVNAIVRIGEDHVARFPLRAGEPDVVRAWLEREARAAAEFAAHAPVASPVPVALGEPGHGYPLPWSVQTWVPGRTADERDASGSTELAHDLAGLIEALRAVDTRGRRFVGTHRGGDLRDHEEWVQRCLAESEGLLDVAPLRSLWSQRRELPRETPDVMTHGDLLAGNVLVADGRLAGVLDTGGFGPADPALELIVAWNLLEAGPRAAFRRALGCGELEWERARAWALQQAIGVVWYYAQSNPRMATMGRRALTRILEA